MTELQTIATLDIYMVFLQKNKNQKGQTLLIVVLVMVISLTIGLSIASKTITNLRTTTEEVSSAQALSAAEAGVQQSIKTGQAVSAGSGFTSNNTTFTSSVTAISGLSILVNAGSIIPQDEGVDVWLIDHDSAGDLNFTNRWGGNMTIYWGSSSTVCNNAALEVIRITGTAASTAVSTKSGYDPCSARQSGANGNNFTFVSSSPTTISGKTFYHSATLNNIVDGLVVRIIPLYTNTVLAVTGSNALPSQGSIVTSTGKSSNVERKLSVVASYYSMPSQFFTYGLFVPN